MSTTASAGPTLPGDKNDPWVLARQRFVETLDPKERDLFHHATLENLYYGASNFDRNDAEQSKTRVLSRKLGPLVSAIESYGQALDTFTNTAPLYLAPIWGCIRVLLVVAKSYGRFYDRIVDTFERIGDVMPRFRDYERIYNGSKHQRLAQALSAAYLDIITLCTQFRTSIREQKSSAIRRLIKPISLDRQFEEAVARFRVHKQRVEEEAQTCHMIEAAEERKTQLVLRAAERKARLLLKLSRVDCTVRHRKLTAARHEGTGAWLIGSAGSGKSVISSSVIDHFTSESCTLFYYFDYADKRTLEPANAFGSLARDALKRMEVVPEALALLIEQADHDGERLLDHEKAYDIFKQAIGQSSVPTRVILDGLDETSEASQALIVSHLRDLLTNASCKLFITGREDCSPLFRLDAKLPVFGLPVTADAITSDISSYVRASTRSRIAAGEIVIGAPELEETIVQKLVSGAQGMFLWVEFQLQDLSNQETDHGIKMVLENLPRSLIEIYDRLLGRIEGSSRQEMIGRMFKWLVCARQPLSVDELREGIAFNLCDKAWDVDKIPNDFNRLVRACGNLVIVHQETKKVQFAHYTVQQYLLSSSSQGDDQNMARKFSFTVEEANNVVGETCVAYLNFSNFATHLTKFKENTNTDLLAINKLVNSGQLFYSSKASRVVVEAWSSVRPAQATVREIDMMKFAPRRQRQLSNLTSFSLLTYAASHWLWHTFYFQHYGPIVRLGSMPDRDKLFTELVLWKDHIFEFRPWGNFRESPGTSSLGLLGWALMANHSYLLIMAIVHGQWSPVSFFNEAWTWLVCQSLSESAESRFKKKSLATTSKSFRSDHEFPPPFFGPTISFTVLHSWQLDRLETFADDSYHLESPLEGWVYSRLLRACRKGHLQVIKACFGLRSSITPFVPAHLLLEAAAHGQFSIVEYFSNTLWTKIPHFYTEVGGQTLNAFEHAVLGGHVQIAIFLLENKYRVRDLRLISDSYFDMMEIAIENDDADLLGALLRLGQADPTRKIESMFRLSHPRVASVVQSATGKGRHDMVKSMTQLGVQPRGVQSREVHPQRSEVKAAFYRAHDQRIDDVLANSGFL